jgi:DUF2934 family protein
MAKPKGPKNRNGETAVPAVDASPAIVATNTTEATSAEPKKSARRSLVVRSEPRANLVPINLDDEIRRLAYLLSERRGFEPGHENEDWLAAEHEVRQRYRQQSA